MSAFRSLRVFKMSVVLSLFFGLVAFGRATEKIENLPEVQKALMEGEEKGAAKFEYQFSTPEKKLSQRRFGNDLLISLGGWGLKDVVGSARNILINYQAGTVMHELGHNLGLNHGGNEGVNDKPNYWSVMNYLYQLEGLDPDAKSGSAYLRWRYSKGDKKNTGESGSSGFAEIFGNDLLISLGGWGLS